jgi:aminomethyltransferase
MLKTVFYPAHINANAKIVEFCGWQMPINYGSQIKEHEAVRTNVGMFDVSHMVITDIHGADAKAFLQYLISNDVAKLEKFGVGKALYSGMLNHDGGVIDDLIVYYTDFGYRLVTNAGTYVKDIAWIKEQASKFKVELKERKDLAILAVQGPNAINIISKIKPYLDGKLASLKPFSSLEDNGTFYARTGYTGEDGLEIMVPVAEALNLWQQLYQSGVVPCGLGARDTLRLEAGMNLYGHDMDEAISPSLCNMDWVVDLKDESRDFIGKDAYIKFNASGVKSHQVGLVMDGRGVLREGQKVVVNNQEVGVITSGTFSPTLKVSIAIAHVEKQVTGSASVDVRGNLEPVRIIKLPFVRNGKQVF